MTEDQKFIFNRSLYNVRELILRPITLDASLINMGINITGPIIDVCSKFPDMEESKKWMTDVYPILLEESKSIMRKKNSIQNDPSVWKLELEKFITPIENYKDWYYNRENKKL